MACTTLYKSEYDNMTLLVSGFKVGAKAYIIDKTTEEVKKGVVADVCGGYPFNPTYEKMCNVIIHGNYDYYGEFGEYTPDCDYHFVGIMEKEDE